MSNNSSSSNDFLVEPEKIIDLQNLLEAAKHQKANAAKAIQDKKEAEKLRKQQVAVLKAEKQAQKLAEDLRKKQERLAKLTTNKISKSDRNASYYIQNKQVLNQDKQINRIFTRISNEEEQFNISNLNLNASSVVVEDSEEVMSNYINEDAMKYEVSSVA
jgi:hypothetical protein